MRQYSFIEQLSAKLNPPLLQTLGRPLHGHSHVNDNYTPTAMAMGVNGH